MNKNTMPGYDMAQRLIKAVEGTTAVRDSIAVSTVAQRFIRFGCC